MEKQGLEELFSFLVGHLEDNFNDKLVFPCSLLLTPPPAQLWASHLQQTEHELVLGSGVVEGMREYAHILTCNYKLTAFFKSWQFP